MGNVSQNLFDTNGATSLATRLRVSLMSPFFFKNTVFLFAFFFVLSDYGRFVRLQDTARLTPGWTGCSLSAGSSNRPLVCTLLLPALYFYHGFVQSHDTLGLSGL